MTEFGKINFKELAAAAESGQGCVIKEAIDGLGYEDRFAALKEIVKENKANRDRDPKIIELRAHSFLQDRKSPGLDLHYVRPGLFSGNPQLYLDFVDPYTTNHKSTCKTIKA